VSASQPLTGDGTEPTRCRLGFLEHSNERYCFEHGAFTSCVDPHGMCSTAKERWRWRREKALPIHRTEAGWPRCSTCDGGGCLDCTDSA
jgi:hypothetical protein